MPVVQRLLPFVVAGVAALLPAPPARAQDVFSGNSSPDRPVPDDCGPGRGEGSGPLLPCGVYRNGRGPKHDDSWLPPPDHRSPRVNRACGPGVTGLQPPPVKGAGSFYPDAPKRVPWSSDPACHGAADWICRDDMGSWDIKCWPRGGAMPERFDGMPIPSIAQASGRGRDRGPCVNPPARRPPECSGGRLAGGVQTAVRARPTPLPCAPKNLAHLRLYDEPWLTDPKVWPVLKRALDAGHASVQSNKRARGRFMAYDEYGVTIVQMPGGYTPEQLLRELATDFNSTLEGYGPMGTAFAHAAPFRRRSRGAPRIGELVDIGLPVGGTVQLVELESDHFIYQTVTSAAEQTHPVSGAREFGFRRLGGNVVFYTRGADRPYEEWQRGGGRLLQGSVWQAYTGAVAEFVRRWKGVVATRSPPPYRVDVRCD